MSQLSGFVCAYRERTSSRVFCAFVDYKKAFDLMTGQASG